jgi:deoxyribonuclease-1
MPVVVLQDAGVSHARGPAEAIPGNATIQSFNKAKKLLQQVYAGHEEEYYCGCRFSGNIVDIKSCGYEPKKNMKKAEQLEWDHVVPAEAFGQSFVEWREGDPACVDHKGKSFRGRNCARKVSVTFRFMEADLYNLEPAIGEANWLRSDYSMATIPGEAHEFGRRELKIQDRKVEPRPEVRGDIARIYFYMDAAYPGHGIISDKNRKLFETWDKADPVDDWERERAKRIEQIQGNRNPFVVGK